MIHDAEKSKAGIYDVPGRQHEINLRNDISPQTPVVHSALLDEDYLLVGSYVDETTRNKIGNGEYVDFAKLMPQDWINAEEDNRMEIVNRGGMSYWVPIADKNSTNISSYLKWEQAFHVFSNIYMAFHPTRGRVNSIQPYHSYGISNLFLG